MTASSAAATSTAPAGPPAAGRLPPPFRPPYAPDDGALVARLSAAARFEPAEEQAVEADAIRLVNGIRKAQGSLGGVEDFLREYGLSTREGLALMVLAEALLRVPDAETADRLIEDKLAAAQFDARETKSDSWLVSASTWALATAARLVHPGETPASVLAGLVRRIGSPAVRGAARQAMRILGHQFVLGETIGDALSRARASEAKGYRHSYDMLGEGARTAADAERYFRSYADAIAAIGARAGRKALPDRPGISVKLSALHPRYEAAKEARVLAELPGRCLELARLAKAHDLNLTIDAEEADRLELSLDVLAAVAADPSLAGWDGFGLAVQAYQKRAVAAVDWMDELARGLGRRFMVRLVKGAYWDTEVKRAQERGLADYPVFTRKPATDLSYIACARRLVATRGRLYPQFATHNALTVAEVRTLARGTPYEFQRLHGMGEALYEIVTEKDGIPCRIYAPVGGHRDLLAYLVRRLLENGANSSFVSAVGDPSVPVDKLIERAAAALSGGALARHPRIPLPAALYAPERRNSAGLEFGCAAEREALAAAVARSTLPAVDAHPLVDGADRPGGTRREVVSPSDGRTVVGTVSEASEATARAAVEAGALGFRGWNATPVADRAAALERAADLLESRRDRFVALAAAEAGKTLVDGIAEVREAVDFCRYYAAEARDRLAHACVMPGPTGEDDRLHHRGRGVFVAISPWNFPLAIFLGQVSAALVAGNTVVAKPAEQTPLIAFEAVKLLHEAGVPASALQFVPGDGRVGAALVADPRVAGVVFTGSTETARAINRALAAKDGPIVPLIAETGGINAMIVDATALPEQVADDVVTSAFRSAGQRCSALRILYVQEDVADRMIEMITGAAAELTLGDPRDPATDVGPVIDREAADGLHAHIVAMRSRARVLFEGKVPGGTLAEGQFVPPTVIELADGKELTREVFGPVLHVVRYRPRDLDRVVDAIAATGYGLTLGIHTRIDETVERIVARLDTGNVYVNRNMIGAVVGTQPFGGSGLSGTGPKAGGPAYLSRFVLEQVVSINTAAAGGNATLIAMGEN
jgi:RHH-type proline utilization regulon transcriptional repressor/proline dehydrogenase/delta 1-pyrroline-5-carboxylate dehydrogenase